VPVDVEVGVWVEGNEDRLASVVIENDGDPLPPGKEYLFDAFVSGGTGNGNGRNLGLGLFVARAVVEAHGGTIEARDRVGGGACFEVQLPVQ
jgi:signal transduction histidine kinase